MLAIFFGPCFRRRGGRLARATSEARTSYAVVLPGGVLSIFVSGHVFSAAGVGAARAASEATSFGVVAVVTVLRVGKCC